MKAMLLAFLAVAAMLAPAAAADLGRMPDHYTGIFQWEGDPLQQQVEITFEPGFATTKSGAVERRGTGLYRTSSGVTEIEVQAIIDPGTLDITLWELNPDRAAFETDGGHQGRLSPDLTRIEAVWTTRGTGAQGRLSLAATPAKPRP